MNHKSGTIQTDITGTNKPISLAQFDPIYPGCKDHNTFMDFVCWDSLENATKAAIKVKQIQQNEIFKEYIDAFEKVEVFNHFKLKNLWDENSLK